MPRSRSHLYQGFSAVLWTFYFEDHASGWLDERFHAQFREVMTHACFRYGCLNAVYCLMPDHWQLMLAGARQEADLSSAAWLLRLNVKSALTVGELENRIYNRALREEDQRPAAFAKICHFIGEGPVRAGLSSTSADYPFCGSVIPGCPGLRIHDPGYWESYWKTYLQLMREWAGLPSNPPA